MVLTSLEEPRLCGGGMDTWTTLRSIRKEDEEVEVGQATNRVCFRAFVFLFLGVFLIPI